MKDAGVHSRGFNLLMAGTVAVIAATWVMGSSAQAQSQRGSLSSDSAQIMQSDLAVFDIPPQSLRSALTSFAEQSGRQLFYSADMAERLHSPGFTGFSTPENALRRILEATGLDFKVTES